MNSDNRYPWLKYSFLNFRILLIDLISGVFWISKNLKVQWIWFINQYLVKNQLNYVDEDFTNEYKTFVILFPKQNISFWKSFLKLNGIVFFHQSKNYWKSISITWRIQNLSCLDTEISINTIHQHNLVLIRTI